MVSLQTFRIEFFPVCRRRTKWAHPLMNTKRPKTGQRYLNRTRRRLCSAIRGLEGVGE
jgi:hypothetical protein